MLLIRPSALNPLWVYIIFKKSYHKIVIDLATLLKFAQIKFDTESKSQNYIKTY